MPLFSIPLSGLTASSTAMSAIANNLANLNTVGYKGSDTQFADLFYQTLNTNGAGDPVQVGAGTAVAATSINMNSGSPETTGGPTDVAIMGSGFFVVQRGDTTFYTRAGDFIVGADGQLMTPNGEQVMGYAAVNGSIPAGAALSPLELNKGQINPPKATTSVELDTNLDARAAIGDSPLSTPVTVYDSLGTAHVLSFNFTKTAAGTWSCNISIPDADLTPPPSWAAQTAYTVGQSISPPSANGHIYQCTVAGTSGATAPGSWPTDGSTVTDGGVTWQDMGTQTTIDNTTLTFDNSGNLISPSGDVSGITASGLADGANDLHLSWNLYNGSQVPVVTQVASDSVTPNSLQDGYGSGSLSSYTIGSDGTIMGSFSNGRTAALGQIALANFANAQGLARVGSNDFSATLASGSAAVGAPGTGGLGTVSGGSLELSNVDIATEFSSLIVAQRDYEANARTITTFDQIMQDTINLKTA
ncbi:MAG TPA: flagellar hook protein FlgE [Chloroflexota bacterium]|nr:flagellar hook protein FlgE [Chloroflexota bacterium]